MTNKAARLIEEIRFSGGSDQGGGGQGFRRGGLGARRGSGVAKILDVVVLRSENDKPIEPDDPEFDSALQSERSAAATHAYYLNVGNDDGALIVYTSGQVQPDEIARVLGGDGYGIDVTPDQVQALKL